MNAKNKRYIRLIIWILTLILVGSVIGSLTKSSIDTWYQTLTRSPLTPPDYVFGIAWSILYAMIAVSGWLIWGAKPCSNVNLIKKLSAAPAEQMRQAFEISDMLGVATKPSTVKPCKK